MNQQVVRKRSECNMVRLKKIFFLILVCAAPLQPQLPGAGKQLINLFVVGERHRVTRLICMALFVFGKGGR